MDSIYFQLILIKAPVILLSLTVHEYCHAYVAHKLGDDTALIQGRLTLNPIVHLDIFGTILMFVVGFGWAKPIPINPNNFKEPKKGMLLVAIAGPLSNLIMAIIAGIVIRLYLPDLLLAGENTSNIFNVVIIILIYIIVFGIALAVFNLIPIPPLDGSRIMYGILPDKYIYGYSKFEPYGILFLFGIFFLGGSYFSYFLSYPISKISNLITGFDYFQLLSIVFHVS